MSPHPAEGTLLAFLDGELSPEASAGVRSHLAACTPCAAAWQELEQDVLQVSRALESLDVPPPVAGARRKVLDRLSAPASVGSRTPARLPEWMRVAAVLVIGVGIAASALPGSPVNTWLRGWAGADETVAVAPGGEGGAGGGVPEPAAALDDVGVFVPPVDGTVRIELTGLVRGSRVRVELVDAYSVGVHAPEGTRFESGSGRVQASLTGGNVRIDLPRDLRSVSLWGNGERFLTGASERLDLWGPGAEQQGDTVTFVMGGGDGQVGRPGGMPPGGNP